jgi:colicin import membrane protein
MAKITKHAEFLTSLQKAMSKQAENPTATGVPGKDTHYVSVSEKTEHVDKNSQGKPEKNPQDFHQKPSGDASEPSKAKHGAEAAVEAPAAAEVAKEASAGAPAAALPDTGKAPVAKAAESKTEQKVAAAAAPAEEPVKEAAAAAPVAAETSNVKLAELGSQLLKLIEGMSKEAEKPEASGVPGKDTHYTSVSEKTEHVDKNKQGKPEKNPQDFSQKPSGDKSEPAKAKKAADEVIGEEAEKIASYEFGRSFFRELVKNAVAQPAPQPQVKTAGRRDFEQLIAQAAAELEQQQVEKQAAEQAAAEAEAAGAAAFQQFYKQAQYEQALTVAQQTEAALNQKIAAIEAEKTAAEKRAAEAEKLAAAKEAILAEKAASEKRAEEFRAWSDYTVKSVIDQLKHEVNPSQR